MGPEQEPEEDLCAGLGDGDLLHELCEMPVAALELGLVGQGQWRGSPDMGVLSADPPQRVVAVARAREALVASPDRGRLLHELPRRGRDATVARGTALTSCAVAVLEHARD